MQKTRILEEIEEDEIKDLSKFLKRVLKIGGYFLLFVQLGLFPEWYESFAQSVFEDMGSLYTIFTTNLRFPNDWLPFYFR